MNRANPSIEEMLQNPKWILESSIPYPAMDSDGNTVWVDLSYRISIGDAILIQRYTESAKNSYWSQVSEKELLLRYIETNSAYVVGGQEIMDLGETDPHE